MAVDLLEMKIPKKAVKPLIEHCNKLGEKTRRSGAEVFQIYLEWMKKHREYFFSVPWPAKLVSKGGLWLSAEEEEFVSNSRNYEEEIERFTVVILKRNINLEEGFDAEKFDSEFDFYGRLACWGCGVPDAVRLREDARKRVEFQEEMEMNLASGNASEFWVDLYEYHKKPEAIKMDMLCFVELKFLEEHGGTEGKVCRKFNHNKYLCPYGDESNELIRLGEDVHLLWSLVRHYDSHWNRSSSFVPGAGSEEWYHYDEPGFLDVTSYDDILKSLEDGRMNRIADEYFKYWKEIQANQPVHHTDPNE